MSDSFEFARSKEEFSSLISVVDASVNLERRFPQWPFRGQVGNVTIYEFDLMVAGDFGEVVAAVATACDDTRIVVIGIEPSVSEYREAYSFYPGFTVAQQSLPDGYGEGVWHEPSGDSTGALALSVDAIAMAGPSTRWAAWGQRDWELGLLFTPVGVEVWRDVDVPFVPHGADLDEFRSPAGWGLPLSQADVSEFWESLKERGRDGH